MTELWDAGVRGLRALYESDAVTPTEVVEARLRRIDRLDGSIGAFTRVFWDGAIEEAERLSAAGRETGERGPLYGIPVAIKEIIDVKGAPITFGSDVFAGRIADRDAEVVRRLRAAGAIVVGITRSHEFAWGITTQHPRNGGTRNPWNVDKTPGGSSGGAAAAVAMGFVPLAVGTDTGGSIRIPAAFCGVCGFKPSWGRISERGVLPLAPSLDHVGMIGRSAKDLSEALGPLSAWDPFDPRSAPAANGMSLDRATAPHLRLGIAPSLHVPQMSDPYRAVFEGFLTAVERAGSSIADIELSAGEPVMDAFGPVQLAEAHHVHSRVLGTFPSRAEEYGSDVAKRLRIASDVSIDRYIEGRQAMSRLRMSFLRALEGNDALLMPVAAAGPSDVTDPDVGEVGGRRIPLREVVMNYTVPANLAGLPTCVIPIGRDGDGVPIGVQIVGRPSQDARVLAIAHVLVEWVGLDIGYPSR